MRQSEERYISLLTDFGFKRIFGTAPNKDLLINFLNSLLIAKFDKHPCFVFLPERFRIRGCLH